MATFGTPFQYAPGQDTYVDLDRNGFNRWGDYSATTLDPSDPTKFWTVQEFAKPMMAGNSVWGTQIAEVQRGVGNTVQMVKSFPGINSTASGFIPPDTMGAIGPSHFAELINGRYAVFDKNTGNQVQTSTLNTFWANVAGVNPVGGTFDPRVLYDPSSKHWFAVSLDGGGANPGNNLLIAVSNTADPTQGWHGAKAPADPNGNAGDFETLGVNSKGIYSSINVFKNGTFTNNEGYNIDKTQLIAGNLSFARNVASQADVGVAVQPVIDLDNSNNPEAALGAFDFNSSQVKRSKFDNFLLPVSNVMNLDVFNGPNPNPPGDAHQPGGATPIDAGDLRISGNTLLADGALWLTQTVRDPLSGLEDIRWAAIDPGTDAVLDQGLIDIPNFDLYYSSISVDPAGDVVIGFSASSAPEPATWLILCTSLLGLLGYSWQRGMKKA
jgi:hypothetical protein